MNVTTTYTEYDLMEYIEENRLYDLLTIIYDEGEEIPGRILDKLEEMFPNGMSEPDFYTIIHGLDRNTIDYHEDDSMTIEEYIDLCARDL